MKGETKLLMRLGIGMIAGAGIAAVDNFAFGGEVSPIVVVGMLLLVTGALAVIWGSRALSSAAVVWAWLPMTHVVKHLFALPDTLHPNTYASVLKLAIFSLVVTTFGFTLGLSSRRFLSKGTKAASEFQDH